MVFDLIVLESVGANLIGTHSRSGLITSDRSNLLTILFSAEPVKFLVDRVFGVTKIGVARARVLPDTD